MPTPKIQIFQIRNKFSNKMGAGQKITCIRKFETDLATEVCIGHTQFQHEIVHYQQTKGRIFFNFFFLNTSPILLSFHSQQLLLHPAVPTHSPGLPAEQGQPYSAAVSTRGGQPQILGPSTGCGPESGRTLLGQPGEGSTETSSSPGLWLGAILPVFYGSVKPF